MDKDDTIHEVDLTEAHVKVAREWGVNKFAIKWGEYFDIAWIKDLFTVSEGRHVLQLKGNSVSHHVITTAKRKTLFNEEIKSFDVGGYFGPEGVARRVGWTPGKPIVIHGVSVALKGFKGGDDYIVSQAMLSDEEINDIFDKYEMQQTHNKLNEWLGHISNPKMMRRLVFGNIS